MARIIAALATGTLALVPAATGPVRAQAPETVGVAAAVHPDTSGTLPGGGGQVLRIGNDVFRDQRIRTSSSGRAQLLFLDETRLSLAPNSEVVLNWYRFDRRTRMAELSATIGAGAIRASAGTGAGRPAAAADAAGSTAASAPPGAMPSGTASVPTAPEGTGAARRGPQASSPDLSQRSAIEPRVGSLASASFRPDSTDTPDSKRIRTLTGNTVDLAAGANAAITVEPNGDTTVISLGDGRISISNRQGETRQLRRPGFVVKATAQGVLSAPVRASRAEVDAFLRRVEGRSGTGQRADERTLNAIARQNSSLSAPQVTFRQFDALRAIDPRDLDVLGGLRPGRLNDIEQSRFLGTLPPPATGPTPPTTPTDPAISRTATPPVPPAPPTAPPPPVIPTLPTGGTIPSVPTTPAATAATPPVAGTPPTPPAAPAIAVPLLPDTPG